MTSALEAVNLAKRYGAGARAVQALDGVSLSQRTGEVLAVLGPNGAGKSTLLRIVATLSRPDGGAARVMGLCVARDAAAVRRAVGFVPQAGAFDPTETPRAALALHARLHGVPRAVAAPRAERLLERFGLAPHADRRVAALSGGTRRRVDVALALLHDPSLLVMDEPTAALDPDVRADLWALVRNFAADEGKTVLFTTHYLEEADRHADRVAIIDRGRVVADGAPAALKAALAGDSVAITLADPAGIAAAARLPGLPPAVAEGGTLLFACPDGARELPRLLAALAAAGVAVAAAATRRPTLDDVYLAAAGRRFAAAHEAAGNVAALAAATA